MSSFAFPQCNVCCVLPVSALRLILLHFLRSLFSFPLSLLSLYLLTLSFLTLFTYSLSLSPSFLTPLLSLFFSYSLSLSLSFANPPSFFHSLFQLALSFCCVSLRDPHVIDMLVRTAIVFRDVPVKTSSVFLCVRSLAFSSSSSYSSLSSSRSAALRPFQRKLTAVGQQKRTFDRLVGSALESGDTPRSNDIAITHADGKVRHTATQTEI